MSGVARRCVAAAAAVILTVGCRQRINSDYAVLRGDSVNGVSVFIDYLQSQGHRVGSSRNFKPGMFYTTDVLVHFNDGESPSEETMDWLQDWLLEESGRHVVWVFRGYDAEVDYWNDAKEHNSRGYTQQQKASIEQELTDARFREGFYSEKQTRLQEAGWFEYQLKSADSAIVETPRFNEEWEPYFDAEDGFRVRMLRKMEIPDDAEPMAWSNDHVLVSRQDFDGSYFWAVANGSFLLNYGLLPHQHRRLAAALADSLGQERRIVFVRRAELGEDEAPQSPTLWKFLTITPINWIAGHLFVSLLAYILYRFAIFGRPKVVRRRESYRFGKHVEALGKMLQSSGDVAFAQGRLAAYKRRRSQTREEHSKTPEPR